MFVAGVGTGGTITGVGEFLGSATRLHIVAVSPRLRRALRWSAGTAPDPGIGAGFVPPVLNRE